MLHRFGQLNTNDATIVVRSAAGAASTSVFSAADIAAVDPTAAAAAAAAAAGGTNPKVHLSPGRKSVGNDEEVANPETVADEVDQSPHVATLDLPYCVQQHCCQRRGL